MARCGKFGCAALGRRSRNVLLALTFALLASPLAAQTQDPRAAWNPHLHLTRNKHDRSLNRAAGIDPKAVVSRTGFHRRWVHTLGRRK